MVVGFILISSAPNSEHRLVDQLKECPGVREVHPLFGEYDLIAKVEQETIEDLGKVVVERIRQFEGVLDTKTLIAVQIL